jgi:hypothetical protein
MRNLLTALAFFMACVLGALVLVGIRRAWPSVRAALQGSAHMQREVSGWLTLVPTCTSMFCMCLLLLLMGEGRLAGLMRDGMLVGGVFGFGGVPSAAAIWLSAPSARRLWRTWFVLGVAALYQLAFVWVIAVSFAYAPFGGKW